MGDEREGVTVKVMAKLRIRLTSRVEWNRFKIKKQIVALLHQEIPCYNGKSKAQVV